MKYKIIFTLVGAVLVLGTGSAVYITKKPFVVPMESNAPSIIEGEETINKGVNTQNAVSGQQNTSTKPANGTENESEDEEDDDGGATGNTTVPTSPTTTNKPTPSQNQPTTGGITLAQVAQHNSRTSCWSAINGNVYDLTSWIPNHPGGEKAILSLCGIDGSAGYNGQHGGKSKPATILAGFKIGVLAK